MPRPLEAFEDLDAELDLLETAVSLGKHGQADEHAAALLDSAGWEKDSAILSELRTLRPPDTFWPEFVRRRRASLRSALQPPWSQDLLRVPERSGAAVEELVRAVSAQVDHDLPLLVSGGVFGTVAPPWTLLRTLYIEDIGLSVREVVLGAVGSDATLGWEAVLRSITAVSSLAQRLDRAKVPGGRGRDACTQLVRITDELRGAGLPSLACEALLRAGRAFDGEDLGGLAAAEAVVAALRLGATLVSSSSPVAVSQIAGPDAELLGAVSDALSALLAQLLHRAERAAAASLSTPPPSLHLHRSASASAVADSRHAPASLLAVRWVRAEISALSSTEASFAKDSPSAASPAYAAMLRELGDAAESSERAAVAALHARHVAFVCTSLLPSLTQMRWTHSQPFRDHGGSDTRCSYAVGAWMLRLEGLAADFAASSTALRIRAPAGGDVVMDLLRDTLPCMAMALSSTVFSRARARQLRIDALTVAAFALALSERCGGASGEDRTAVRHACCGLLVAAAVSAGPAAPIIAVLRASQDLGGGNAGGATCENADAVLSPVRAALFGAAAAATQETSPPTLKVCGDKASRIRTRFDPLSVAAHGVLWVDGGNASHRWLGHAELAEVSERNECALWGSVLGSLGGSDAERAGTLLRLLGGGSDDYAAAALGCVRGESSAEGLVRLVRRRHELGEWEFPPLGEDGERVKAELEPIVERVQKVDA